jgi:hypothetical protein
MLPSHSVANGFKWELPGGGGLIDPFRVRCLRDDLGAHTTDLRLSEADLRVHGELRIESQRADTCDDVVIELDNAEEVLDRGRPLKLVALTRPDEVEPFVQVNVSLEVVDELAVVDERPVVGKRIWDTKAVSNSCDERPDVLQRHAGLSIAAEEASLDELGPRDQGAWVRFFS